MIARLILLRSLVAGVLVLTFACTDSTTEPVADFVTPHSITIASGNNQSTVVGQNISNPLVVIVWTPTDHKCDGCRVVWSAAYSAEGTVTNYTDPTGFTQITVNGLQPAGTHLVRAQIDNGQYVDFTLQAF